MESRHGEWLRSTHSQNTRPGAVCQQTPAHILPAAVALRHDVGRVERIHRAVVKADGSPCLAVRVVLVRAATVPGNVFQAGAKLHHQADPSQTGQRARWQDEVLEYNGAVRENGVSAVVYHNGPGVAFVAVFRFNGCVTVWSSGNVDALEPGRQAVEACPFPGDLDLHVVVQRRAVQGQPRPTAWSEEILAFPREVLEKAGVPIESQAEISVRNHDLFWLRDHLQGATQSGRLRRGPPGRGKQKLLPRHFVPGRSPERGFRLEEVEFHPVLALRVPVQTGHRDPNNRLFPGTKLQSAESTGANLFAVFGDPPFQLKLVQVCEAETIGDTKGAVGKADRRDRNVLVNLLDLPHFWRDAAVRKDEAVDAEIAVARGARRAEVATVAEVRAPRWVLLE